MLNETNETPKDQAVILHLLVVPRNKVEADCQGLRLWACSYFTGTGIQVGKIESAGVDGCGHTVFAFSDSELFTQRHGHLTRGKSHLC